eukprot:SAG22_NODE_8527_length_648_cov_1.016393_1_plen_88_part_00
MLSVLLDATALKNALLLCRCGATKEDFDNTVGIHPTIAEEFTTLEITKVVHGRQSSQPMLFHSPSFLTGLPGFAPQSSGMGAQKSGC